jgi:hypothetical protein
MSNDLIQTLHNLPPIPAAAQRSIYANQRLGEGIEAPFAIIGYKGGKWSIKHRGQSTMLYQYDENGKPMGPKPFIDVVIVGRAPSNSKVYYAKTYAEGDDGQPDCWSSNGQVPDPSIQNPQSRSCVGCKWNQFGSRVNTATGSKGKACADIRRIAVVPADDVANKLMGGPMLLRVPPASLSALGQFSDGLESAKYPFNCLVTRIGFDPQKAYPLFTFQVLRAVTDEQMEIILEHERNPVTQRILDASDDMVAAAASQTAAPQLAAPAPAAQPVTAPVTPPAATPQVPVGFGLPPAAHLQTSAPPVATIVAPRVAVATPAAPAVPPCPPGVDPAQWAAFQAMQAAQTGAAQPQSQTEAPKPRQRRTRTAPPSPAPTDQGGVAPASASNVTQLPGVAIVPDGDADEGDDGSDDPALADISKRLASSL